ncbi:translation initiation factor IF-2-like [Orcinus orca]|uniref:translation initiation factor IF-2-like n=1 Tax=Orcinus orca TaxID=9733 RepID=UPI002112F0B5|nr:translation initiation factor IF-2-like [Orcinus orca]
MGSAPPTAVVPELGPRRAQRIAPERAGPPAGPGTERAARAAAAGPEVCSAPTGSPPRAGAAPGGGARDARPRRGASAPSAALRRQPPAHVPSAARRGPRAGAGRGGRGAGAAGREDGPGAGARRTGRALGRRGARSRGGGGRARRGPTTRAETRQPRSLRALGGGAARWPELSPPRRPRRESIQGRGRRDPGGARRGPGARGREETPAQPAPRRAPCPVGKVQKSLLSFPFLGLIRSRTGHALGALKLPVQNSGSHAPIEALSFPPCTGVTHRAPVASTFLLPAPVTKKKNILSVFRLRGVHVREQQNHHYFVESP